jgi:hypothetical protein
MSVATRIQTPLNVFRPAMSGHCNDEWAPGSDAPPDFPANLVTVDPRQTQVQQDHVGSEEYGFLNGFSPIGRHVDLMTLKSQEHRESFQNIRAVINDQYSTVTGIRHAENFLSFVWD